MPYFCAEDRPLYVNVRALAAPSGDLRRYVEAILTRVPEEKAFVPVTPKRSSNGLYGHAWELWRLPRIARNGLLWSPCNSGPIAAQRHVVTIHDLGPLEQPRFWPRRYAAWCAYMAPRVARSAMHVLTASSFTRERVHERLGVPLERITAIPLAPRFAAKCSASEEAAQCSLKLPPYVLALGSVHAHDSRDALIDAWRLIASDFPNVRLRIIGSDRFGFSRTVRSETHRTGRSRIEWLTGVPESALRSLFAGATAFVTTSRYEGFGWSALDALSVGTPVIASNIPAHREVVSNAGIYVDAGDPIDVAEALHSVLANDSLRQDLEQQSWARASAFCWDETARRTLDVLDDCLWTSPVRRMR